MALKRCVAFALVLTAFLTMAGCAAEDRRAPLVPTTRIPHVRVTAVALPRRDLFLKGAEISPLGPATRLTFRSRPVARVVIKAGGARVTPAGARGPSLLAEAGDVVLIGPGGRPRLSTWPFARSPRERAARREDRLPSPFGDGLACSVGCRPAGARTGWPLRPFHAQHALRSGLNELRPANLHIGVDIQAADGAAVYAVQDGRAHLAGLGTVDARVEVGDYAYWHVVPRVSEGQTVTAFRTVLGVVLAGAGHLHFSELRGGAYLDPLRPGGRVLAPYSDTDRPVIGRPRRAGGVAFVEVFDPQSYRVTLGYRTPVIAPAAVAWRASDAHGRRLAPLTFAYRGSQHLTNAFRAIYAPGTHLPQAAGSRAGGWECFRTHEYCVPRWRYRLWGLPPRTGMLTLYAWDWAGNVSVRSFRRVEQLSKEV